MTIINKIEFIIDHIDPLGQGVFKDGENIYFIPKTLPGESGTAKILKRKKGVHFCELISLSKQSDKREKPLCSHFSECQGCHFLHTDYESEINYKLASFKRMLTPLNTEVAVETILCSKRVGYRNRIQLHYNKKVKMLGFINPKNNRIVPAPSCEIATDSIRTEVEKLYDNKNWLELAPKEPKGHVEIYESPEGLKINWNKRYSSGGFTQVNNEMNLKLKESLNSTLKELNPSSILDLFGGGGNLSESYPQNRIVVDIYNEKMPSNFISLNLHEEGCLETFMDKDSSTFDTIIVDPPRAGFPDFSSWMEHFLPQNIVYISCHPQTMVRDLRKLLSNEKYRISKAQMLDLFPSTFHFEAMIVLEKVAN